MTARITIEPGKRSGQPCIRGLRITVWDVLHWLAGGMTEQQILEDYPELQAEDFRAVYEFAARLGEEGEKIMVEPVPRKSLLSVLATLAPLDEEFPDISDSLPRAVEL